MIDDECERLGITRIANVTGLDCIGIPTAIAIRPNGKHMSLSMGKGATYSQAMISAIMESIELFHLENPPPSELSGSFHDLSKKNIPCISPNLFPKGFFVQDLDAYDFTWRKAFDLMNDSEVYIPHILTDLNSTKINPAYAFLEVSTNGLGAANQLDEAIQHALFEVIERDSLARFAALPKSCRDEKLISLHTDSLLNQALIEKYLQQKMQLKIWDATSALGIPTFHCAVQDLNPFRLQGVFRGTGTHVSPEIALARALMEAAQSRLALIAGSRDDVFADQYENTPSSPSTPVIPAQAGISLQIPTCAGMTEFMLTKLKTHGFHQVLMVNHTKPEFNIPVVQVFIPGMQTSNK